jgi:EAL domain-containing protein (putative c-di-GMP-specific phosphodiesterase class I)
MGIAIYPDDGTEPEQLQRAADSAMYCAKKLGRNRFQTFAAKNDTLDRARMDEQLRLALRHRWFVVHYQSKIRADGEFAGLEALVRINHPKYGEIPPASFISVAEENGLIVPIGAWVLDEVCRQAADWQRRGFGQIPIALKISPVQLSHNSFAKTVIDCLERHHVSPQYIELELTETVLISCAPPAQEQMRELRALGIRLSLDHFGTGYSSLSYLHRLQIDTIKLDKSFVQTIETDEQALRLIHAMIGVAEGLGLDVIAEGVETEGQREALVGIGCPLMQGYLFAHPQSPAELEPLLRKSRELKDTKNPADSILSITSNPREPRTLASQPRPPRPQDHRSGRIPVCNPTIM